MKDLFFPEGVYCAMATPFAADGSVDLEQAKAFVRFLIEKHVNGVFPVSNVGEFLLLSMDERKRLIRAVLEEGRGRLSVTPGVSDLNVQNCLELAGYCKEQGANGVVLCAPYYYPYTQAYIAQFLKTVVERSKLPVILYNAPTFTNRVDFEPLAELCMHGNVAAVKESSGDVKFLIKLLTELRRRGSHAKVLLGWEELLYTGLTLGADGCMVTAAGIVPELLIAIRESFAIGNTARALEIQKDVAQIVEAFKPFGFPHGYKLGVLSRGFDFRLFRDECFRPEEEKLLQGLEGIRRLVGEKLEKNGFTL